MIDIQICTRDRATELCLLLQSLRLQTMKDFNIYILDDASGTPLTSFHFFNSLVGRLKHEGHGVEVMRNTASKGIARARQQLMDIVMKDSDSPFSCRLDDDVVLEPDYLERLLRVIKSGYDIASGVTPPVVAPLHRRPNKFVHPIINRIVLNEKGGFLMNMDDCGRGYMEDEILPAHHFRSNALIKREVHEKVRYEDTLCEHSFREETFFSLRAHIKGYKIGIDTGAIAWHFAAPSGGERSHKEVKEQSLLNQKLLNRWVKRKVIEGELKDLIGTETSEKDCNLIYSKEE